MARTVVIHKFVGQMESIKNYFENIPTWHRSLILAGGLMIFYLLEYIIPYITFSYSKLRHAGINIFFTTTTAIVNFALAFATVWSCSFVADKKIGLLQIASLPPWAFLLSGLLLLDLIAAWLIHYLQHKIKWMWKFHIVHHADTNVDVTSANRHHPGESIFRFAFTILGVFITGSPIWLIIIYQSLSALFAQYNHANITLPKKLDEILSWLIVSPNMHKVHHHYLQPYTDSNYANIFSIWDRIFGTFKTLSKAQLVYGIDTHMNPNEHSNVKSLLSIPFQPYRITEVSKFSMKQGEMAEKS